MKKLCGRQVKRGQGERDTERAQKGRERGGGAQAQACTQMALSWRSVAPGASRTPPLGAESSRAGRPGTEGRSGSSRTPSCSRSRSCPLGAVWSRSSPLGTRRGERAEQRESEACEWGAGSSRHTPCTAGRSWPRARRGCAQSAHRAGRAGDRAARPPPCRRARPSP